MATGPGVQKESLMNCSLFNDSISVSESESERVRQDKLANEMSSASVRHSMKRTSAGDGSTNGPTNRLENGDKNKSTLQH